MSWGETFNVGGMVASGGGGGGSLVANIAAARSSGAAPLYVNFDATGTTSAIYGSDAWKNVLYTWSFGDTAGGATWSNGFQTLSKNFDQGPNVGHVFETPGTYTVYLTAFDGVNTSTISTSITVDDPDVVWAGAKTVCFSIDGDFTGAPSGCTQVTVAGGNMSTNFATYQAGGDKRLLYKRGQAWTCSTELAINTTKGMIGVFGPGTGGITVTATQTGTTPGSDVYGVFGISNGGTCSDWRIVDINIAASQWIKAGGSYADCNKLTVLRQTMSNHFSGWGFDPAGQVSSTIATHDQICIQDCNFTAPGIDHYGAVNIYAGWRRSSMLGNYFDNNSLMEHVVRVPLYKQSNIAHNTLRRPRVGKETIKLHAMNFVYTGEYSEDIGIYNNFLDNNGGVTGIDSVIHLGDGNPGTGERVRRSIVDSNGFRTKTGACSSVGFVRQQGQEVVVRNNMFDVQCTGTSGDVYDAVYVIAGLESVAFPTDRLEVYNNSMYTPNLSGVSLVSVLHITTSEMTAANSFVRNNIMYVPNTNNDVMIVAYNDTRATASNNTSSFTTNPNFTTTPPTTAAQWKPTSGYAVNGGTSVPVWNDALGVARTGTYDMGAVQP